ncbi:MAG: trypsin-like peptidase domain-containing protein [Pirellulaceae bacterium]
MARWMGVARALRAGQGMPVPVDPRGEWADDEKTTIRIFSENSPSVAFITTTKVQMGFFEPTATSQGTGSGFVWDQDGHIVTNFHVIADSDYATVTLADKSVWEAEVIGREPSKDLAVLRIDAPSDLLRPIMQGSSNDLQVGQKVFAIGNPFGLDYTLTTGVISALDRQISTEEGPPNRRTRRSIDGVVQTDAAINPGNSGGPLLDSAGRLIGVNTAIYSPSGAYAGVGFAIPSDTVRRIVPQLIQYGRLIRPGIGIVPFLDQTVRSLEPKGVLVRSIYPGSAAEQAGLRPTQARPTRRGFNTQFYIVYGDLIVQADGKRIESLDNWYSFLESKKPGDQVTLTIIRGLDTRSAEQLDVQVTLEEDNYR